MKIPQRISRLGQAVSAVNDVIDLLPRLRILPGLNTRVSVTESGASISAVPPPATPAVAAQAGIRVGVATGLAWRGGSASATVRMLDFEMETLADQTVVFPEMSAHGMPSLGNRSCLVYMVGVPTTEVDDGSKITKMFGTGLFRIGIHLDMAVVAHSIDGIAMYFGSGFGLPPLFMWDGKISSYPAEDLYFKMGSEEEKIGVRRPDLGVAGYMTYEVGGRLLFMSPSIGTYVMPDDYPVGSKVREPRAVLGNDGIWRGDGWWQYDLYSSLNPTGRFQNSVLLPNEPAREGVSIRREFNGWQGVGAGTYTGSGDKEGSTLTVGNPSWKHEGSGKTFIRNVQRDKTVHFTNMGLDDKTYFINILNREYKSGNVPDSGQNWAFEPREGEGDGVTLDWDGYKMWAVNEKVFVGQGVVML